MKQFMPARHHIFETQMTLSIQINKYFLQMANIIFKEMRWAATQCNLPSSIESVI